MDVSTARKSKGSQYFSTHAIEVVFGQFKRVISREKDKSKLTVRRLLIGAEGKIQLP